MESCYPEKARFINGQYLFSTYGINNSNLGLYTGQIEYPKSVTGIIRIFPSFLKIDSDGLFRFFRTYTRAYEPLEKQQLSVHVFEQDSNLHSLLLQELSCASSHISCYGVWKDPVIYNDDFTDILTGYYRDPEKSGAAMTRRMGFRGSFMVFMEPGVFYFMKIVGHNPDSARILEVDFKRGKDA